MKLILALLIVLFGVLFAEVSNCYGQTAIPLSRDGLTSVQPRSVWPHLREHLQTIGDRLNQTGKERTTLTGTITRGSSNAVPVRVLAERGVRIRVEEGAGSAIRSYGFGERGSWGANGNVAASQTAGESDVLETLLYDSAERFFVTQATGAPTRFYGSRFRTDDGRNANYQGPYYDLYEVWDEIGSAGRVRRPKVFCLNWRTRLLERVQYRLPRGAARVATVIQLEDWRAFEGQQYPTRITRTEDKRVVWTLRVSGAATSPAAKDGLFDGPAGR